MNFKWPSNAKVDIPSTIYLFIFMKIVFHSFLRLAATSVLGMEFVWSLMVKTRRLSNAIVIQDTLEKNANFILVFAAVRVNQPKCVRMVESAKIPTFHLATSVIARPISRGKTVKRRYKASSIYW